MRAVMAGLVACAVLYGSAAGLAATRMAPNDIQTTFFNGKPFTASTPSNIKYTMVFTADGKMTRQPQGQAGGNKGEGTWKLSKDGFCTTWKGSKAACYTLVTVSPTKWNVMRGPAIAATWTK